MQKKAWLVAMALAVFPAMGSAQAPHGLEAFEGVWVGTEQSRCSYTDRYTTGAGVEKGTPKYDCAEGSGSNGPLMVRVFVGGGLVPADLATWDGDLAGDGPWVWHDKLVWIDWSTNWMDGTWGWIYKSDWWQGFGNGLVYGAYTPLVATGTYSDTLLEWTEQYVGWGQWHVQLELDEEGRMSTKVEHRWDPEGLSEGKAAFKMTGLVKQVAP